MSTMPYFYTTVPESGTITLPEEFRGKPLKIVVEEEPAETGILGLRGIMKGCTTEELEDARYEYLMKKYR